MKVAGLVMAVSGGRDYRERVKVFTGLSAIHTQTPVSLAVEGGAQGADRFTREWATAHQVNCLTVAAKWAHFTPTQKAGPARNAEMGEWLLALGEELQRLWVFFPGGSGTASAFAVAQRLGIPTRTFPC